LRPGPPPSHLLLCSMPTALPSPEQTHSTPRPSQNPSSTRAWPPCPVSLNARAQDPHSDELLDARAPDAPPYKYPRRSNGDTRLTPSYLPDNLSPSLSLWFVDARHAGEVLDAKRAAEFDHLGASRRWESEEKSRRSRSRPSPSSSASSTPRPRRRTVFSATPVSFRPS
jgi:hypothetical protein